MLKKKTIETDDIGILCYLTSNLLRILTHIMSEMLLQVFDSNYHDSFKRGLEAYVTAEANLANASIQSAEVVREGKLSVLADKDKQHFFEDNHAAFVQPFTFAFLPHTDEEVRLLKFNYSRAKCCKLSNLIFGHFLKPITKFWVR